MSKALRTLGLVLMLVAAVALVGCSGGASPSATSPSTAPSTGGSAPAAGGMAVSIAGFAFSPAALTVKVGDTVTWTNNDSTTHTVTGPDFESGPLAPGKTFSHKFTAAGTFDYHCSIHPNMTGSITVQ